jgi:hypothetical protein
MQMLSGAPPAIRAPLPAAAVVGVRAGGAPIGNRAPLGLYDYACDPGAGLCEAQGRSGSTTTDPPKRNPLFCVSYLTERMLLRETLLELLAVPRTSTGLLEGSKRGQRERLARPAVEVLLAMCHVCQPMLILSPHGCLPPSPQSMPT